MKGYYRHKKGNLYRVLYEAKDSETCKALIVYQAMYGKGEVWVRPKEMFFEEGRFTPIEKSEALVLIPIELNPKYRFPNLDYTADLPPLRDGEEGLSKNVKAMKTLLTEKGLIDDTVLVGVNNDDDLEVLIKSRIASYREGDELEEIFHLIQIWGGNSGRGIYVFDNGFDWKGVEQGYRQLANACLAIHEVNDTTIDRMVKAVRDFNKSVKNLSVAFITKHTRYWLHSTLGMDALPIYDSIMAVQVMQRGVPNVSDLSEYWKVMVAKAQQLGIGLVPLERQIFKYAYEAQQKNNE